MKFEKIKSGVLLALIALSLYLTSQIWFSDKLWPYGYNFFISVKNNPIVAQAISTILGEKPPLPADSYFNSIYTPKRLIVTSGESRALLVSDSDGFKELNSYIKGAVTNLLKDAGSSTESICSEDDWFSAIKSKSVFIDYGTGISTKLFALFNSLKDTYLSNHIKAFSQMVLTAGDTPGTLNFYIKDYQGSDYYKYVVNYDSPDVISNAIDKYAQSSQISYKFAFELKLSGSAQQDSSVSQKTVLDPLVLLPQGTPKNPSIKGSVPFNTSNMKAFDDLVQSRILRLFGYNASSARKLTDKDDTLVYVENYSTLKVHPNGLLEFNAINTDGGIPLLESGQDASSLDSEFSLIKSATSFMGSLQQSVLPQKDGQELRIASPLMEDKSGNLTLKFDYYVSGIPAVIGYDPSGGPTDAVEIDITNGYITGYKQYLRVYDKQADENPSTPVLYAIDGFYQANGNNSSKSEISDVFLAYNDTGGSGNLSCDWKIRLAGGEIAAAK